MRNKDTLFLLIISSITVLVWVGLELSKAYYQSTSPEILEEQIRSLQPDIDSKTLAELANRQSISQARLDQIISNPYITLETQDKKATSSAKKEDNINVNEN